LDNTMSESKTKIEMHPGKDDGEKTISFHRPLQVYFKLLKKNSFFVSGLEEWISDKKASPARTPIWKTKPEKNFLCFCL